MLSLGADNCYKEEGLWAPGGDFLMTRDTTFSAKETAVNRRVVSSSLTCGANLIEKVTGTIVVPVFVCDGHLLADNQIVDRLLIKFGQRIKRQRGRSGGGRSAILGASIPRRKVRRWFRP